MLEPEKPIFSISIMRVTDTHLLLFIYWLIFIYLLSHLRKYIILKWSEASRQKKKKGLTTTYVTFTTYVHIHKTNNCHYKCCCKYTFTKEYSDVQVPVFEFIH